MKTSFCAFSCVRIGFYVALVLGIIAFSGCNKTVSVTGVTLDKTSLSLVVGGTANLSVTVQPYDAVETSIKWTSSDNGVASVNAGTVSALKEGAATITASTADGAHSASCEVSVSARVVSPVKVTIVRADGKSLSERLFGGQTIRLKAVYEPVDANVDTLFTLKSSDPGYPVDERGFFTGGSTINDMDLTVTATNAADTKSVISASRRIRASKELFFLDDKHDRLSDAITDNVTFDEGKEFDIHFMYRVDSTDVPDADNSGKVKYADVPIDAFEWETTDAKIIGRGPARVGPPDPLFLVRPNEDGSLHVMMLRRGSPCFLAVLVSGTSSAIIGRSSAFNSVRVAKVTVTPGSLDLIQGNSAILSAGVMPSDATFQSVKWSSSNPGIVSVDANGVVTAKVGDEKEAVVTAVSVADESIMGTCTVRCLSKNASKVFYRTSGSAAETALTYSTTLAAALAGKAEISSLRWEYGTLTSADVISIATYTASSLEKLDMSHAKIEGNAIPAAAFLNFLKLKEALLPESMVTLGEGAFTGDAVLSHVHIGPLAKNIGGAFINCPELDSVSVSRENVNLHSSGYYVTSYDGQVLFFYSSKRTGSVSNPKMLSGISQVADRVFDGYGLHILYFVDGVRKLGRRSFAGEHIADLVLPKTMDSLYSTTFEDCNDLEKVHSLAEIPPAMLKDGQVSPAFYGCKALKSIAVPYKSVNAYKSADGWKERADIIVAITADIDSVSISRHLLEMSLGTSAKLTAEVHPENAASKVITWSSGDEAVATVDMDGNVKAVGVGRTYVRASSDVSNIYAECVVVVTTPLTGIVVDKPSIAIMATSDGTLTATLSPEGVSGVTVNFTSSDPNIVTVDNSLSNTVAILHAVAPGTATVTATTSVGNFMAKCDVLVGIAIPDVKFRTVLTSKVHDYDANHDNVISLAEAQAVTEINANNMGIQSLEGLSYFTALKNLYCSQNQISSLDVSGLSGLEILNCSVNSLVGIDVSHNHALMRLSVERNLLTSLDVSGLPSLISLSCDRNKLSTLDASTVVGPDSFELFCGNQNYNDNSRTSTVMDLALSAAQKKRWETTFQGSNRNVNVNVTYKGLVSVAGVALDRKSLAIMAGENGMLTATVTPSDASDPSVTFVSSNPSVLTVENSNDNHVGYITTIAPGEATITVTTTDGGKMATCDVTVGIRIPDLAFRTFMLDPSNGYDKNADGVVSLAEASAIASIDCSRTGNIASAEGIGYMTSLASLNLSGQNISSIDLTRNAGLTNLSMARNVRISSIDLWANTLLTSLDLSGTSIRTLDISRNASLVNLNVEGCMLGSIDLSSHPALKTVDCAANHIASLDATVLSFGQGSVLYCGSQKDIAGAEITLELTLMLSQKTFWESMQNEALNARVHANYKDLIKILTITLDSQRLDLQVGETHQLAAAITPSNATDRSIKWSSSDTSSVKVSATGLVTAVGVTGANGASITAAANDGSGISATCHVFVSPAVTHVTGVDVTPSSVNAKLSDRTAILSATVRPADATDKSVLWTSSNPNVATVEPSSAASGQAIVTFVAPGSATITVTTNDGKYTATCDVTVTQLVTGITIDPILKLIPGQTHRLVADVTPSNATNTAVVWNSSAPGIATVDQSGNVSAVSSSFASATHVQTASITATAADGSGVISNSCVVTVYPVQPTGIKLLNDMGGSEVRTLEMEIGNGQMMLFAEITPADADLSSLACTSSHPEVAGCTVSVQNNFTLVTIVPLSSGTTNISVSVTNAVTNVTYSATCAVTVVSSSVPVTSIAFDKDTMLMVAGGARRTLSVLFNPTNATNRNLTWSSSDSNIATVDQNGVVTAVGCDSTLNNPYLANIMATSAEDSKITASCQVYVRVPVAGVTISPSSASFNYYNTDSLMLKAVLTPYGCNGYSIQWSSSVPLLKVTAQNDGRYAVVERGSQSTEDYDSVDITVTVTDFNTGATVTGVCRVSIEYLN
jgi:uncharacterized protein YjdB